MKKIFTLGILIVLALTAFSQKNVTQFLGIPIDGTKDAMIKKLKAKGFTYNVKNDYLNGQFNGRDVHLHIVTNGNKVYRIMVADAIGSSEGDIKIRFNKLCNQFEHNGKYIPQNFVGNYTIGEEDDISYEIIAHDKRYEAAYYQTSEEDYDSVSMSQFAFNYIQDEYGEEKWNNMSEEERQTELVKISLDYINDRVSHKSVWFMISRSLGGFYINIYYDNEKNQANGEDL